MTQRLYDIVKTLLIRDAYLRSSDKKLIWEVWKYQGYVRNGVIDYQTFMNKELVSPESIRRSRQKIQEKHKELQAVGSVFEVRQRKRKQKGTFIFREPLKVEYIGDVAVVG
jgi:hypothetical protein